MWIRKEYMVANSWTKMYSVELDMGEKVLGLKANREFLVLKNTRNSVSYNPCKRESFDLQILGFTKDFMLKIMLRALCCLIKIVIQFLIEGLRKRRQRTPTRGEILQSSIRTCI